jgi:hypothetical protein
LIHSLNNLFFKGIIIVSLLFQCELSYSQEKCGTDSYKLILKKKLTHSENDDQFEKWLKENILKKKTKQAFSTKADEVLTVPIVVHVIHQGESLGSESNIPDEQVLSQIDILNKDFRRLNEDASSTPAEFLPVAADVRIEFLLAKRDPEGLPTTAIVRHQGALSNYGFRTDRELKTQSYWPAEDYLNVWVTTLSNPLIGYAQFPTSNLSGLDMDQKISRLTDGIVIDYRYMGEGHNALPFSSGRTATHEIGHFIGLKHIWGSGCATDDFCDDTPNKSGSTQGCPTAGSIETCESIDMFQNYLDLADDECMNLFTICQGQRMRTILENSPRRKSLLTSKALIEPTITANDIGIKQILSPLSGDCRPLVSPQIEVRNYGTNTVTDFKIDLHIDGNLVEVIARNTIVSELSTSIVSFSEIDISLLYNPIFEFTITETNNVPDGNSENNIKSIQISFAEERPIPYFQNFESSLLDWQLRNSVGASSSWIQSQAPYEQVENKGIILPYYQNPSDRFGEIDILASPVFDLSSLASADISFKYAYAAIVENAYDVFTVAVSTDCGNTFPEENYIYQRFSPLLSTAGFSAISFIPEGPDDWKEIEINISEFAGNENVVIGFIGHNGGGNNLYLDDFSITSENKLDYDLAIKSVDQISPVSCDGDIFPSIEIKNQGTNSINSFELTYVLDGSTNSISFNNLNILPGKSYTARPSINNIASGSHQIQFSTEFPNGKTDENQENDSKTVFFQINISEEKNPLKQDFENFDTEQGWTLINPNIAHNWQLIEASMTGKENQALLVDGFNITELGIENWLVSPVLDLTESNEASLVFKVSYGSVSGRNDRLKVLVSLNCGRTFNHVIFNKAGEGLAVTQQTTEWVPSEADHWKTETIDLSEYAIWPEVRVAFVVTNQNGNNIYLDDIEFYNANNPNNTLDINEEKLRIYPNPLKSLLNLKFDITEKTDLEIQIIDMMGKVVHQSSHPNTLNQTFIIENISVPNGIYMVRVNGENINLSRSVLVWN